MRFFSSELGHNYETYTFGYTNYCECEASDSLAEIYDRGYLPYSGAQEAKDTFYMARSARVDLQKFERTSENRRIAKKFDGAFEKKRIPFAQFEITEEFLKFCLAYFAARHGERAMPKERLLYILNLNLITNIMIYHTEDKPVAYVFEIEDGEMAHYWFSFYDLSLAQKSLGLYLMLNCLEDAKKRGQKHYYLGTVYGEKALYKTNFTPLQWWDGAKWNANLALLKELSRGDVERHISSADMWKKNQRLF